MTSIVLILFVEAPGVPISLTRVRARHNS
jgi:hypothetical protein